MMTQCAHGVLSNGIDIFLEGVDKGPSKMNDRRETLKIFRRSNNQTIQR
jgi:hypothetical protein